MKITTMTSRELNQDIAKAKREALNGPVFITDRGKPAFVLSTMATWQKANGQQKNIVELLRMEGAGDIEFEPPRFNDIPREADFS